MASVIGLISRIRNITNPPTAPKQPDALRIGILGAARIAPDALILPARSHPGVIVSAVAARDKVRAAAYAKKHGIPMVFNSYQALVDEPTINAVYNPLPNGLHYEWTMKAIAAGKHVLLEKPSCNTAEETRRIFEFAKEKGVVVLEAFHYRFHPAVHRLREIIDSGELGKIQSISSCLAFHDGFFAHDDIRLVYDLGGGALMDMGTYPISVGRFLTSSEPVSVISATSRTAPKDERIDTNTTASLLFPNDIKLDILCDMAMPPTLGFIPKFPQLTTIVKGERGEAKLYNYIVPSLYHSLSVTVDGKSRTEKVYTPPPNWTGWPKAEPWWTTYRYQLEAFVDKVRGRQPHYFMEGEDSVGQMQALESVYEKTGLGLRPASTFTLL